MSVAPPRNSGVRSLLRKYGYEAVLLLLLASLLLFAAITDRTFLSPAAQWEMSTHIWEMAILALPMTLIVITGGIDLSVGSTMALSAVVLGMTYQAGVPPYLGAVLAIFTGAAAGALNGAFVARLRVHPLIVTLATLAAYRGIAEGVSVGKPVSGFPASFTTLGQGNIAGIPIPGLIFAVAAACAAFALTRTVWGRSLYAIGWNETGARFSGIPTQRIQAALYTLAGSAAGVAAVLFVARRSTARADIGQGMELDAITAVLLGGASIFGGRGRIGGTLLSVLLIHEAREWVSWRWERDELNLIVIGTMLILSVLLNAALSPDKSKE